jgi:NAD(P)-dependent dehydrogenase (short-subunit alcohol dehydrogenase family)
MALPKVIILGGYGVFGRLITEQLVGPNASVVIAGRDPVKGEAAAEALQAEFVRCDARDTASLRTAVDGGFLVVNASGPFQAQDYSIPQTCLEQGCHYIDLGDGRDYVAGITQLHSNAQAKGVLVCAGASTTPAVTSALVEELRSNALAIRSIKIALNAGNKNQAGVSTIASILAYVGRPMRVWENGQWQEAFGWGLGEFVDFPKPAGRRRVQLCDVPDLELFPSLFDAETVVFKAGVELTLFNYAIAFLGRLRRRMPRLNLPALAGLLVKLTRLFKWLGTLHGSCAVWVTGDDGHEHALAVIAPQNGPRIPSSPAVLLSRKLLAGDVTATGAFPCVGFLSLAEFVNFLEPFGIFLVRGEDGRWDD